MDICYIEQYFRNSELFYEVFEDNVYVISETSNSIDTPRLYSDHAFTSSTFQTFV